MKISKAAKHTSLRVFPFIHITEHSRGYPSDGECKAFRSEIWLGTKLSVFVNEVYAFLMTVSRVLLPFYVKYNISDTNIPSAEL
jgi:hypothetical protein